MIRIVIAEDQGMLLGALGALLNLEEDMEVVGRAKNGEEAVRLVKQLQPDVCIMDIEMPIKTGLEAAEELMDEPCKVIMLTTFARPGYFERARNAKISGYLLKDSPSEELANAIRTIIDGRKVYAPELVDMSYGEENPLTERETEVIKLIAKGKDTKEIARELFLTSGTVRNYVSIIMDKLKAKNRIEAIARIKEKDWFK